MKAFVSWSGGKETALSFYKAVQNHEIEVTHLLNMLSEDGRCSRTHGVSSELLKAQAKTIGLPIIQRRTIWETYEEEFKKAALELKTKGIDAGIFGDIDLEEHRDWVERVCKDCGIKPIFPLWKKERQDILMEFVHSGFKAAVVAARADVLGSEWIGRKIDEQFIKDLKGLSKIDLCGEAGEYHTFVTSGPIFKKKINILKTAKIERDKHCFLDILDYEITD